MTSPHDPVKKSSLAALALGALGVVYGDIGTSPLYTVHEVFAGSGRVPLTPENVVGVVSVIFWSLMIVVSLKYVTLILRADNNGEGGIMALMALVMRIQPDARRARILMLLGLAGVPEFADATVFRPDIVSLRQKVRAALDASLPDGAARVIIQLTSGETFSEIVMAAKGSLADPLSDRDIEAKLRDGAQLGGTDWDIDRVIDEVWHLDTLADVSSLMRARC